MQELSNWISKSRPKVDTHMSSFLTKEIDFAEHNDEVRRLWDAFDRGEAWRAPCHVGGSISNYLLNPDLNTERIEFKDLFESAAVQINVQLEYLRWKAFNLHCDCEMGVPSSGWQLFIDFQNSWEATWFGCPIQYHPGLIPDTIEILRENKEALYDMEDPDPLGAGLVGRGVQFYEETLDRCPSMEYMGAPVLPPVALPGEGVDGPFLAAYKLRGAENLLMDMLTDEQYYHDLMTFITRNTIRRMKALREYRWSKRPDSADRGDYGAQHFFFADDAIAMISLEHYKEFVYPYHKMILDEIRPKSGVLVHACGDATRHFKFIAENLGAMGFDTGFPVDFGWLRQQLGPDVYIRGGPTVMLIKDGDPNEIDDEVRRIAQSGVLEGGKFVFIAANNLAPCTPVENVSAFYESVRKWATY